MSISETPLTHKFVSIPVLLIVGTGKYDIILPIMTDAKEKRKSLIKRALLLTLAIVVVIAITVTIQLLYGRHPERLLRLQNYVYAGAFLISVIGNATIFFPGAVLVMLANIGLVLYPTTGIWGPVLVGLAGGAGAALGEMTGYLLGAGGRGMVEDSRLYRRLLAMTKRWGIVVVFVFSIVPFFFDVVGIIAGALRIPLWKFVLFCWLGRSIMYVGVITAVSLGYQNILPFFS